MRTPAVEQHRGSRLSPFHIVSGVFGSARPHRGVPQELALEAPRFTARANVRQGSSVSNGACAKVHPLIKRDPFHETCRANRSPNTPGCYSLENICVSDHPLQHGGPATVSAFQLALLLLNLVIFSLQFIIKASVFDLRCSENC